MDRVVLCLTTFLLSARLISSGAAAPVSAATRSAPAPSPVPAATTAPASGNAPAPQPAQHEQSGITGAWQGAYDDGETVGLWLSPEGYAVATLRALNGVLVDSLVGRYKTEGDPDHGRITFHPEPGTQPSTLLEAGWHRYDVLGGATLLITTSGGSPLALHRPEKTVSSETGPSPHGPRVDPGELSGAWRTRGEQNQIELWINPNGTATAISLDPRGQPVGFFEGHIEATGAPEHGIIRFIGADTGQNTRMKGAFTYDRVRIDTLWLAKPGERPLVFFRGTGK
jgi:hypothetical protein